VWKESRAPAGRKINFPFKRDISPDKIKDEKGWVMLLCVAHPFFIKRRGQSEYREKARLSGCEIFTLGSLAGCLR